MAITVLWEDLDKDSVESDDAATWAEQYGMSSPVLADTDMAVWERWKDGNLRPQIVIIDQDLGIRFRGDGGAGHEEGLELVETLLAE